VLRTSVECSLWNNSDSTADNVPCYCCSRVTEYVAWVNERDESGIRENEKREINLPGG
jgi:hypothetical protein